MLLVYSDFRVIAIALVASALAHVAIALWIGHWLGFWTWLRDLFRPRKERRPWR